MMFPIWCLLLSLTSATTIPSTVDAFPIAYTKWIPSGESRGVLYIVHGMAEHKGRYEGFARELAEKMRITVVAHDQRGHGETVSSHCDLGIFQTNDESLRNDAIALMSQDALDVIAATREGKVFVLGHSMGSVVARRMLTLGQVDFAGMLLSGVPTAPTRLESYVFPYLGASIKLARGLGHELVQNILITGKFDAAIKGDSVAKNRFISSDTDAVESYNADPLCGHLVDVDILVSVGSTLTSLKSMSTKTNSHVPLLFICGRQDPVCNFGQTATADAQLMTQHGHTVTEVYLGAARHEFINEKSPLREQGIKIVADWINHHL